MSKMNTLGNKNMQGKTPAFLKDNGYKKQGRGVLGLVLLAVFGVFFDGMAWGQTWDDGLYYLKSTSEWYLWPSVVTNNVSHNRYLTTFQGTSAPATNNYVAHDSTWCMWVVKNVAVGNNHYIQLINPKLDQYVVIYDKTNMGNFLNGLGYGDRDVWLSSTSPTDLTRTYFWVNTNQQTTNNGLTYYRLSPTQGYNGQNGTDYTNRSFNSAASDKNGLGSGANGTDLTDQRAGLIQLYNGDPKWAVVPALLPAPTINYDNDRNITISYDQIQAGFDILYTTDGNDPTIGGAGVSTYDGTSFSVSNCCTLKAVVARYGLVLTEVASQDVEPAGTPPAPTIALDDPCNNIIVITHSGCSVYYTTNGSDPSSNNGTPYSGPFQMNANATIKAVQYYGTDASSIATFGHNAKTMQPTITVDGNTVTILGSGSIYYTTDGSDPTTGSTLYTGPFNLESGTGTLTIKAVAQADGLALSCVAEAVARLYIFIGDVVALNNVSANDDCLVVADFDASDFTGNINDFSGIFDGGMHIISGLTKPLFNSTDGGVVKNVMLKNVTISKTGDVGAIVCDAKGYTRIYNCGILPTDASFSEGSHSIVASTGDNGSAGGLVGKLEGDSRVVNCFSYADVSSTAYAAGIVGNNTFASTAEVTDGKYTKLRTMVVNCMFYGDITAGSNVWPVYGGEKIINGGGREADISDGLYAINNYNFYSDSCSFPAGKEPSATHIYNCSWPAKYEYLTRYEFHRYLLNSNRELCGWWVGAPIAPSAMSTTDVQNVPKDASLMAKWVLDRSVAPFPILKPFGTYPSPINIDADATWRESANEWEGKQLGTLSVTVNPGDHAPSGVTTTTTPLEITITDMDTLHGDFGYRKIQLPYYNTVFGNANGTSWVAKYGGNYREYAVTGWEITKVDGSSTGTGDFVEDWQDGYNFADRKSTKKDLYGVSGRIFAQGGYYYVPDDVTNIEIKAHWGKAVYLGNGDNYYDRVDFDYLAQLVNNGAVLHRENRPGTAFEPAGTRSSTLGNGHTIRTGKIADVATNYIASGETVFDNALVLVGNHQYCTGNEDVAPDRRFTIMSADFDLDNEPDYCLDWQLGVGTTRQTICPIRFDFLPVVEIGLGLKKDGSTQYYSLGCYRPKGHFEVTETALIRFGQFEFSNVRNVESPIILNGGIFDQYVKGTQGASNASNDKITYVIIGGNLKMLSFTPGAHVNSNATYSTRHCAVNAIGGRFESLYLSGNFNEAVTPNTDNPHCYIDGGWFGHVAAAGKEGIDGDVTFKINHAVIHEFYGGGIMSGHEVTGSIDVTVDNSLVNKYCGGPKFGNMTTGKTVMTSATGTTFGVYYGAGNGGTNYVQYQRTDGTFDNSNGYNWNSSGQLNGYIPGTYRDLATGYQADYDMELINVSTGSYYDCAVNRTYFYAAQYSATNTGTVTNTLTDCTVKTNFYGAGNLGGVNGNVTSTLTDTKVRGSAFGGGFSASIPKVTIYNKDKQVPVIDLYTGSITPQSGGNSTTYTWSNDASLSTGSPIGDGIFFTEVPLTNLGTVSGDVTLTIQGESVIGTSADGSTGNVFGGGDESAVTGSTLVKILGRTKVFGNIYGGGNMGNVGGNTKVIINGQQQP